MIGVVQQHLHGHKLPKGVCSWTFSFRAEPHYIAGSWVFIVLPGQEWKNQTLVSVKPWLPGASELPHAMAWPGPHIILNYWFCPPAGGYDGQTFLDSVECYEPTTDTWTEVTRMTSGRSGVGVAITMEPCCKQTDEQKCHCWGQPTGVSLKTEGVGDKSEDSVL